MKPTNLANQKLTRRAFALVERAVNRSHKNQTPEQKRRWLSRSTLIVDLQEIERELDRRELLLPAMLARAGWHMVLCNHPGDQLSWFAVVLGLFSITNNGKAKDNIEGQET